MVKLKTKRLMIFPMSDSELRNSVLAEKDGHMKDALNEMLTGCLSHPAERNWYTCWRIALHDGTPVGSLGFKGVQKNGEVEIGYGIDEAFRNMGYATESVRQAINWAFSNDSVYFVTAETEADNAASLHVLEKLGFVSYGGGAGGGPRFEIERPKQSWMAIFMCLGVSIGCCFGVVNNNITAYLPIGLCIGLALGVSLDESEKKKRRKLRDARKNK